MSGALRRVRDEVLLSQEMPPLNPLTNDLLSDTQVFWIRADGWILDANEPAALALGYSREELRGLAVWDLDPDFPRARWPEHWEELRRAERLRFQTIHQHRDGSRRRVEVFAQVLELDGHRYNCALVYPLTPQRLAENALRESEERLALALAVSGQGLYDLDLISGKSVFSDAYARMLGYEPSELELTPALWESWLHPNECDEVLQRYQDCLDGRRVDFAAEHRLRTRSGDWLWVRSHAQVVQRDVVGQPLRLIGTLLDISERKRAERALHLARTAIDKSRTGFYWLSQKGQVIDVNQAAADSLGYSREELVGLYVWDFDPNYAPEMAGSTWDQIRRLRSITFESCHRRKDGTLFPIEGTTNYIRMGSEEYAFTFVQDISERKAAEAELRASEERFAKAFRASPALTVLSALEDGRIIDANDRWLETMGYRREEVIGRTAKEIDLWIDARARAELISALKAVGSMRDVPLRVRDKTGEERDQLWSAEILSLRGQPVLLSAVQDITERKQANRDLQLAQLSILRSADAVFWITPQGRFIHVNDQACESLGYAREALLNMGVWDIDPEFSPQRWPEHWKLTRILKKRRFETRHQRRDGSIFPVEVTANYIDYEGQEYDFAFVRDITERKCAEDALRASEHKFRAVVQNAQAITFILDHQGVFLLSEGQCLSRLGLTPGQVVGQCAFDLYAAYPSVVDSIRNALSGELAHTTNVLGDAIFDTVYSPYYDRNGQPGGVIGIAIDITERMRAEEELRQHREHLEELVTERTIALHQAMAQLVQAEKLAALGHLVAGVAHELNTPLGNARMVASTLDEWLREATVSMNSGELRRSQLIDLFERAREAVALLERNTVRAADLIGHFKQVAVDQTSMRRRRFNLRQTVEEVLATLEPTFKRTAHQIEVRIPPDLELDSYPGPLEQIIANLIGNSLTHGFVGMEAGCIEITAQPEGPEHIALDYRDNGSGIPQSTQTRIFEPFFTTRLGQGGSGLGLYIVYNLVTGVLGGIIEVHSQSGDGTAFRLSLPCTAPQPPAAS